MSTCKFTSAETQCWQDWLIYADLFFFLMKSGCIDFLDFVHKLSSRVDQQILGSNHVTWLLAQIIRIETVVNTLSSDPKKVICLIIVLLFIHGFFLFCFWLERLVISSFQIIFPFWEIGLQFHFGLFQDLESWPLSRLSCFGIIFLYARYYMSLCIPFVFYEFIQILTCHSISFDVYLFFTFTDWNYQKDHFLSQGR